MTTMRAEKRDNSLILNPARDIIRRLGGIKAVAAVTDRDITRVKRWTWPREKDGSDGMIPVPEMLKLIEAGDGAVSYEDFFKGATDLSRSDIRVLAMLMDGMTVKEIAAKIRVRQSYAQQVEDKLRASDMVDSHIWTRVADKRAKRVAALP